LHRHPGAFGAFSDAVRIRCQPPRPRGFVPLEQNDTKRLLKQPDLPADPGLCGMQGDGRLRYIQRLINNFAQVAHLLKVHVFDFFARTAHVRCSIALGHCVAREWPGNLGLNVLN
jgi:hypothetical protein